MVIFIIKNKSSSQNQNPEANQALTGQGLTYNSETFEDLVNKDTDGDGIPDWQEKLWGTDPTKKETTPGIPDSVAIAKLKQQEQVKAGVSMQNQSPENLTKTDQFSRDLFSTVAAASQDGQQLDQATVDQISGSLADKIQNSTPRKVFTIFDLSITNDQSKKVIEKYRSTAASLFDIKNSTSYSVIDVLKKFEGDGETVDSNALALLDPIIAETNKFINGMTKMQTPQSFAPLHLELLNNLEIVVENLNDIKLYDKDPVVALGAINNYEDNAIKLQVALQNFFKTLNKQLSN